MRPIKYRVWDKTLKLFGQQFTKHIIAEDGTEYKAIAFAFSCGCKPVTLAEAIESNNYDVIQSTGLLDKNGTEICGGDILNYEGFEGYLIVK